DFNGDGLPDVAVASASLDAIMIHLNQGQGHFAPAVAVATGSLPLSVTAGGLNGDGRIDLAVPHVGGYPAHLLGVSIHLGNGDGTFAPHTELDTGAYAQGAYPEQVAIGDVNADGRPDLAVANNSKASVFFGHGDGTFDPRTDYAVGAGSNAIVITDLNLTGHADPTLSPIPNTL